MKLQSLLVVLALAAAPAFAHTVNGSEKHVEHHAKARHHVKHVASVRHHRLQLHAKAHRRNTHAMGAGPLHPMTDMDAAARQHRMDQAYDDWLARRR